VIAESHAPGNSCASCPATLPQEAHPAVPVHERSLDPARTSSRAPKVFPQLTVRGEWAERVLLDTVGLDDPGQIEAGACHRALTGTARSLSPNGRVEVPV